MATASLPDVNPRPFSVTEYHLMVDAGILSEDDGVELLEGVIVLMSPLKDPHAQAIEVLKRRWSRRTWDVTGSARSFL